jgi:hypothetical protein
MRKGRRTPTGSTKYPEHFGLANIGGLITFQFLGCCCLIPPGPLPPAPAPAPGIAGAPSTPAVCNVVVLGGPLSAPAPAPGDTGDVDPGLGPVKTEEEADRGVIVIFRLDDDLDPEPDPLPEPEPEPEPPSLSAASLGLEYSCAARSAGD